MAKDVWPDYSFVRDGLTLEQWLWQLVDDSQTNRIRAGESLQAMLLGLPSIHTDWSELAQVPDTESGVRFDTRVRQVLAKSDFNTELFVERLGAYRLGLDQEN